MALGRNERGFRRQTAQTEAAPDKLSLLKIQIIEFQTRIAKKPCSTSPSAYSRLASDINTQHEGEKGYKDVPSSFFSRFMYPNGKGGKSNHTRKDGLPSGHSVQRIEDALSFLAGALRQFKYKENELEESSKVNDNARTLFAQIYFVELFIGRGQFDEALQYYKNALAHAEVSGDKYGIAALMVAYCLIVRAKEQDFSSIIQMLTGSLDILISRQLECDANKMILCRAYDLLSDAYNRQGQSQLYKKYAVRAVSLAKSSKNGHLYSSVLLNYTRGLMTYNEFDLALDELNTAYEIATVWVNTENSDVSNFGRQFLFEICTLKCGCYFHLADSIRAMAYGNQARALIPFIDADLIDGSSLQMLYFLLALAEANSGKFEQASVFIDHAKTHSDEQSDAQFLIGCFEIEAQISIANKDFRTAKQIIENVFLLVEGIPDMLLKGRYIVHFTEILFKIEEHALAWDKLTILFNDAQEHGLIRFQILALCRVPGLILIHKKSIEPLIEKYLLSCTDEISSWEQATIMFDAGRLYLTIGKYKKAIEIFTPLIGVFENAGSVLSLGGVYINLSDCYIAIRNVSTAFEYIEKACSILKGTVYYPESIRAHLQCSSFYIRKKDMERAEECLNYAGLIIKEYGAYGHDQHYQRLRKELKG